MSHHALIDAPYMAYSGKSDTFSAFGKIFSATSLRKTSDPVTHRQLHFERQLLSLAEYLETSRLPIFVDWQGKRRMDKGCIGHGVAGGFLLQPTDNDQGWLEYVDLSARHNVGEN